MQINIPTAAQAALGIPLGAYAAVAVGTTDVVLSATVEQDTRMAIEVKNAGANALDAFEVWGRTNPSGQAFKLAFNSTDYTTPVYPVIKASASPTALAAGASAWIVLNIEGFCCIELRASSAVGATTLEFHCTTKP